MDPNALASQLAAHDASYNPTQIYNDVTTKLGIPDARVRVQNLQTQIMNSENAIKAVDPSVTGRTQNSLVTESQRQRLVNMERQPLSETYNDQNKQYGVQQGLLQDLTGQANTQVGLAESSYKSKRDSLATQLDTALKQQSAAQAKAEADRAFAENQRQFNASNATNAAKGSGGKSSPADTKLAVAQHVASSLSGRVGKDGKVSNETWAGALNDAVSAGFTVREFWQKFGQFVNTKYKSSYAGYGQR